MNNKGNVGIIGLFILQFLIMISINFSINLDHLLKINKIDPTFECVKIQVIQRIKSDFYHNKNEDFELEIEGYYIKGSYEEDTCHVVFDGKHDVEMKITYDQVYLCIASIEYDYENWE